MTPDLDEEEFSPASPQYGGPQSTPFGPGRQAHVGHALTSVVSRKSHHTHTTQHSRVVPNSVGLYPQSQWKHLSPKERFRAAARKIISMRRGATLLGEVRRHGGEPGVDPRRESDNLLYGDVHKNCKIEIVDYSAIRHHAREMGNEEFVELMEDDNAWAPQPWVKCRWINIGGVSWDVIKALSLRYCACIRPRRVPLTTRLTRASEPCSASPSRLGRHHAEGFQGALESGLLHETPLPSRDHA